MAKSLFSIPTFALILLILIPNSGRARKPPAGNSNVTVSSEGPKRTWCVAKPSASEEELTANTKFACGEVGFKCDIVKYGQPCFFPNRLINHASVAMNIYYRFAGMNVWNCDFKGSALITTTDPSYESCGYA